MNKLEKKAYAYVTDRQKDPNYPTYNWETEISDAYEQGYKDAVNKACKIIDTYLDMIRKDIAYTNKEFIKDFKKEM